LALTVGPLVDTEALMLGVLLLLAERSTFSKYPVEAISPDFHSLPDMVR
jgi:hypothetical protein